MKAKQRDHFGRRLLLGAALVGALSCSIAARAQADAAKPMPVPPLEQSASRRISARDPSSIVKCKDEYWVF